MIVDPCRLLFTVFYAFVANKCVNVNVDLYSTLSHSASNALDELNTAETDASLAGDQSWAPGDVEECADREGGCPESANCRTNDDKIPHDKHRRRSKFDNI